MWMSLWVCIRDDSRQHWLHCLQELKLLRDSRSVTAISFSKFWELFSVAYEYSMRCRSARTMIMQMPSHSVLSYMFVSMMQTFICVWRSVLLNGPGGHIAQRRGKKGCCDSLTCSKACGWYRMVYTKPPREKQKGKKRDKEFVSKDDLICVTIPCVTIKHTQHQNIWKRHQFIIYWKFRKIWVLQLQIKLQIFEKEVQIKIKK